jgi:hypothetical protein
MSKNTSTIDLMLAMVEEKPAMKTGSAPAEAPVAPSAPAAPAVKQVISEAAAKIASAEEAQMQTSAAAYGVEFAKAAEAYFEEKGTFKKAASAPGAGGDINQAAVDAAFKAGMTKGAEDTVAAFRQGYSDNLKIAHDLLTITHLSGQAHSATLRKHASDLAEKKKLVESGQLKQADAGVHLAEVLPFVGPSAAA